MATRYLSIINKSIHIHISICIRKHLWNVGVLHIGVSDYYQAFYVDTTPTPRPALIGCSPLSSGTRSGCGVTMGCTCPRWATKKSNSNYPYKCKKIADTLFDAGGYHNNVPGSGSYIPFIVKIFICVGWCIFHWNLDWWCLRVCRGLACSLTAEWVSDRISAVSDLPS